MEDKKTWTFLIVAGGSGNRIGGTPKQFRKLGGIPMWKWSALTADKLWKNGEISELVLVLPAVNSIDTASISDLAVPVKIEAGGKSRSESVVNGLKASCGSYVLIHDAARPFVTVEMCRKIIKKAEECGSAVPLLPSVDSLKKLTFGVAECADRSEYFRTQTPQAFATQKIADAIKMYGTAGTDEAESWIAAGNELGVVEGEESNFKLTTPFDLAMASAMAEGNIERRTGHGFDVHRLVSGRKLILAGVEVKDSRLGLLGHSDADIITHAVMDAILGAAGEPDIGTIFPASDARWKDAVSTKMLSDIVERVRNTGWKIDWVDVTLEAETPRLGGMIPIFESNLSRYLTEPGGTQNINIKVKSGEGCGSVGRSECMVCHAVATLSRISGFL